MNKYHELPFGSVQINDEFWAPRRELVKREMIPYQWRALNDELEGTEPSGCLRNFRIAAGLEEGEFYGRVFQDSDLAKWIESAAFTLSYAADEALEKTVDEVIELLAAAQQKDGYLNTYYIINGLEKRFTNVMYHHELYCCGHFIEAAVAYWKATGKRRLLDVMCRYADYIDSVFGPEEGKLHAYPGHEIIEMALVKLAAATGEKRYLDLAEYFVNERGQAPSYFEKEIESRNGEFKWRESPFGLQYYQAGMPVRDQKQAQGHAVRAVYLYAGMADVARMTNDQQLYEACRELFDNISRKQMYITGSIGASTYGESFVDDYELPNDTVYGETCAAIGLVFFAYRMLQMENSRAYSDVIERVLYNGAISGMSLDGKKFFYVNPLEVFPSVCKKDWKYHHVKPRRQGWFKCACCPPNLARMVASVSEYVFTQNDDRINMHLYMSGTSRHALKDGEVCLRTETRYPWNGDITVSVDTGDTPFTLALRIPGWCRNWSVCIDGQPVSPTLENGYVVLSNMLKTGSKLQLHLEMPVRLEAANPRVRDNAAKVAVVRGPLVYCAEEEDNGAALYNIRIPGNISFAETETDELNGMITLTGQALRYEPADFPEDELYCAYMPGKKTAVKLKLIPYYAWANRSEGKMTVWLKVAEG